MTDAFALVFKSLNDFKNNLIVLVPTLIGLGFFAILGMFVLLQFLVGTFLFKDLASFAFWAYGAFFFLFDFVILILINSYYQAAQYGFMADAVNTGKSSFKRLLQHGRTFFKPMLTFTIAEFIIMFTPAVILFLMAFLAFKLSIFFGIVMAVIFALLYTAFLIGFFVMTLFSLPILIEKKLSGFNVIIESFKYGKANFSHVIITTALVVLIWIAVSIISTVFYIPAFIASLASEFAPGVSSISLAIINAVFNILSSIVSWIGGLILSFFIFNSYFSKNSVKK